MTGPVTGAVTGPAAGPAAGAPSGGAADADAAKLRRASRQLTGVFAQQLFKAMRATVPQGEGVVDGGSGEEMFTGMLDEHLAGADPGRPAGAGDADGPGAAWTRALADAVFRRMRPGAAPESAPGAAPAPAPDALTSAPVTPTLVGASLHGASRHEASPPRPAARR